MNKDELRDAATNIKTSEVERTWQAYLTLPYRSKSEYKALVHGYAAGYEAGKQELTAELKELREFVGAMHNCVLADGAFCCEVDDGVWHLTDVHDDLLASGTDPFDAWRKMNAGEVE